MMTPIRITDNHDWVNLEECCKESYTADDIYNLERIANVNISELHKNSNLLVFPTSLNKYGDDIGDGYIVSLRNAGAESQIATGNVMGFIGINGTQINIRSRFAKEDDEDYFLHYMLMKVFSINLFDLKHSNSHDNIFDFLLFLFPYYLKKAIRQGLFKKYRKNEYNDANVRGVINVNRHIRQNVPFCAAIAYDAREHSYDNPVTQLVRHTIEYISGKSIGKNILQNDLDTKNAVAMVREATPTFSINNRSKVLNQNLRPTKHPYYTEYTMLQKICVQILQHKKIKFGNSKDQVYGVLFDGAWLWEEYLYTMLKSKGFEHPKNKTKEGGFRMFETPEEDSIISRNSRKLYPDFYKENFILDAKYKHLEWGVGREDLYQVVTYMYCKQAHEGGYAYPSADINAKSTSYKLAGYGCQMSLLPFIVPSQGFTNWKEFVSIIKQSEKQFVKRL